MNDRHRMLYEHAAGLAQAGRHAEAEAVLHQLLREEPTFGDALNMMAVIAAKTDRPTMAREFFLKTIAIDPNQPEWLGNYAQFLMMRGEYDEGLALAEKLLAIDPDNVNGIGAKGTALARGLRKFDEAIVYLERAVKLAPGIRTWLFNLGIVYLEVGRFEECEKAVLGCIAMAPTEDAYFMLSECLLTKGDFARGWEAYEGRYGAVGAGPRRHQNLPAWRGEDLRGRSILLWADQALGDTIQFARFARILSRAGARVVFECNPSLKPLFERCDYIAAVRAFGEQLPHVEVQMAQGSLPRMLGIDAAKLPGEMPYLSADPKIARRWSEKLKGPLPKVGLVWAGNPKHTRDKDRSIAIEKFMAIAQTPGVNFYSLQVGLGANLPLPANVTNLSSALKTWDDTAGIVANLDLVITVDTAVCHLAGAMNRRVWTLVTHVPDWRWLLNRSDSPWYPSMRIYRQPARDDWASVIAAVSRDLQSLSPPSV